jgi:NAD(P)-dependent dehydrogenase (short-subunit alcohol dehydrogenase family)
VDQGLFPETASGTDLYRPRARLSAILRAIYESMLRNCRLGMGEKEIEGLVTQIPSARRGRPSEIASAVVFLASDESAFTVGSELIIDGGMKTL